MTVSLVPPDERLFPSFVESLDEWGDAHQNGAGIRDLSSLGTTEGFSKWVRELLAEEVTPARADFVTCTYRWIVDGNSYLGSIALRHRLNGYLAEVGGHVGYSVRPSARGRGLASWALGRSLELARDYGLQEVLVTCADTNIASARTIEANGGILEGMRAGADGLNYRRYWMPTSVD
jgi:predicted acetyltransferase